MKQEQDGGEGSTNYQAAGDINSAEQQAGDYARQQQYRAHIQQFYETHVHQVDGQDARQYLLELFHENFPKLHADAMDAAIACAEEMAIQIVVELVKIDPSLLSALRKPRVQAAIVSAQRSYAETGDPDTKTGDVSLGQLLAKLVSRLATEQTGGLADIILRGAVDVAPKLTRRQLHALSVVTIWGSMVWPTYESASDVLGSLDAMFSPYFGQIPSSPLEYSYMSAAGVGTYLIGPKPYEAIRDKNVAAIRKHFRSQDIPDDMPSELRDELIEPVPGDDNKLRMVADAGRRVSAKALPGVGYKQRQTIAKFVASQFHTADEIKVLAMRKYPALAEFLDRLESASALFLTPNATGYVLAKHELELRWPGSRFVESLSADLARLLAD